MKEETEAVVLSESSMMQESVSVVGGTTSYKARVGDRRQITFIL